MLLPFTWTKSPEEILAETKPKDNFKHAALGIRVELVPRFLNDVLYA
jgi:hypothetical protein